METQPFLNNLWDAELVLEQYGSSAKVYPCEPIFVAFNICELKEMARLLTLHERDIPNADELVKMMHKDFDSYIVSIEKDYGYRSTDGAFDPMDFLEATSMGISRFRKEYDITYLCWPVDDRDSLTACFREYHEYKFYEKHMYEIPMGVEKFLSVIPEVEFQIQRAKIKDDFYWDREDTSFLHEYREAKRALMSKRSLPSVEV